MGYVPNNGSVYTASYTGAMAGMATGGNRVPSDTHPSTYASIASIAGAFAQSFDTVWGATPANGLELGLIEDACFGAWDSRVGVLNVRSLDASNWTAECQAIIANITASDSYYASQGIVPPSATTTGGRTLPALDASDFLVWDFQLTTANLPPVLGSTSNVYRSTGTQSGAGSELSRGYGNGGGSAHAVLGPGGVGLQFANSFYVDPTGSVRSGNGTPANPPQPADNASVTIQSFFNLTSLKNSAQGVISSKSYNPLIWAAPFNALEVNMTAASDGTIEFGMVDSANVTTEIGVTIGGASALTIGYHHTALVIDQTLKRGFLYLDGFQRAFFTFTNGIALGTGGWLIGGNYLSTNDSSNITYSRVCVSTVARTPDYIAAAAAGFLRS